MIPELEPIVLDLEERFTIHALLDLTGRHVSKYGRSDRTLREKPKQQMRPAREVPHRDDWKEVELDRDLWALRDKKATGYNRVTVMPSTLRGAGRGLFATKEIREDGIICGKVFRVLAR